LATATVVELKREKLIARLPADDEAAARLRRSLRDDISSR
jgi:hypothetical protein